MATREGREHRGRAHHRALAVWPRLVVESESEAGKFYFVLAVDGHDTCSCQDYQRRGGPCKHILATTLYARCERADAEQADPTVIPFPTPTYSDTDRFLLTPLGVANLAALDNGQA